MIFNSNENFVTDENLQPQDLPQCRPVASSGSVVQNNHQNLGNVGSQASADKTQNSKGQNLNSSYNNELSTNPSSTPPQCRVVTDSSSTVQDNGNQNLGIIAFPAKSETESEDCKCQDDVNEQGQDKQKNPQRTEEKPLKHDEPKSEVLVPSAETSTKDATSAIDSAGSSQEELKKETKNLEILLKDLYAGGNQKEILSDQKLNEPFLVKFFEKYREKIHQKYTYFLAIMLAGLYFALDDLEGAKVNLDRIENPDNIDDNNDNAGIHRAYYIMQANLEIEAKNFKKARELLKKCWNIQQKYFSDGKEDFLNFYATSLGYVHLKERKFKEAEHCFKDALALRLYMQNSRLISSSYNDLALLYIEKGSEQASEYLKKAREYDKLFQEELDNNKYNVLSGQVDFKRPNLSKTEKAYKKI